MAGITLSGFGLLAERLETLEDNIKFEIDIELSASVKVMAADAVRLASQNTGNNRLGGQIKENTTTPFQKFITVNVFYAPYVEFGTGQFAAKYVPTLGTEIEQYARTFFVTGKGRDKEKPYLFPSVNKEFPLLVERIQKILEV